VPRPLAATSALAACVVTSAFALTTTLAPIAASAPPRRHAHLVKSEPMADSTVAPPAALRLWFNEAVDVSVSSVRLRDSAGGVMKTGALAYAGPADAKSAVTASIAGALKPGTYRVSWVAASRDGHPVKGEFAFHVTAAR
jgi:methionine-rich copper-binding protein CopC